MIHGTYRIAGDRELAAGREAAQRGPQQEVTVSQCPSPEAINDDERQAGNGAMGPGT
jgi:hypothetical protein